MSIAWWGVGGLTWAGLRRSIESQVLLCQPPRIIVIHLGGNDLTLKPCTAIENAIAKEIRYLRTALPDAIIIWVDILDRLNWRSNAFSKTAMNKKRKRVNRSGRSWVTKSGRSDVLRMDINSETPGFYLADGVHLSLVGLEFYLDALKDTLLKHI